MAERDASMAMSTIRLLMEGLYGAPQPGVDPGNMGGKYAHAEDCRAAQWSLLPFPEHGGDAGRPSAALLRRSVRHCARRRTLPLRRIREQAVLRRHAFAHWLYLRQHRGPGAQQARGPCRQA